MTFVLLEFILAWGEWNSQDLNLKIFEIENDFLKILAAEGDTADRVSVVPVVIIRGENGARIEGQVVCIVIIVADGWPIEACEACAAQDVAWIDVAASDKHQRRLHNSIRISWGLGDEIGEATVSSGVASRKGRLS